MNDVFRVFRLEIFRDHLVQRPSFPAMNLLHGQAFVFLGQGARQGMGVVPEIDSGHPWDLVHEFTSNHLEDSLSVGQHIRFLSNV